MLEDFLNWFRAYGGTFDSDALEFTIFPESEGGRGVGARVEIPVRLCAICLLRTRDLEL